LTLNHAGNVTCQQPRHSPSLLRGELLLAYKDCVESHRYLCRQLHPSNWFRSHRLCVPHSELCYREESSVKRRCTKQRDKKNGQIRVPLNNGSHSLAIAWALRFSRTKYRSRKKRTLKLLSRTRYATRMTSSCLPPVDIKYQ